MIDCLCACSQKENSNGSSELRLNPTVHLTTILQWTVIQSSAAPPQPVLVESERRGVEEPRECLDLEYRSKAFYPDSFSILNAPLGRRELVAGSAEGLRMNRYHKSSVALK